MIVSGQDLVKPRARLQPAAPRAGQQERKLSETSLPGTLVDAAWLLGHLGDPKVRVVDIRGYVKTEDLGNGRQRAEYIGARDEYDAGHIPNSVFIDWTSDITDPEAEVKAQLAPPERFLHRRGQTPAPFFFLHGKFANWFAILVTQPSNYQSNRTYYWEFIHHRD